MSGERGKNLPPLKGVSLVRNTSLMIRSVLSDLGQGVGGGVGVGVCVCVLVGGALAQQLPRFIYLRQVLDPTRCFSLFGATPWVSLLRCNPLPNF